MQRVRRRWCTVLLIALRAGAVLERCAAWCASLYCASIVWACRNALRKTCSIVLLFPLLLRNALCGCAVGNVLFYRIGKSVLHLCSAQHPCSNPALRLHLPFCKTKPSTNEVKGAPHCIILEYRISRRSVESSLYQSKNVLITRTARKEEQPCRSAPTCMHLQPYPIPAHCVSNSEKRSSAKQVCCSASLIHLKQSTHNKKRAPYCTFPKHCTSADATGGAMQYHLCTNLHARNLPPAPARSAVNRTASVTTGHQAALCYTKLRSKIETRFQQVCYPRPLFFFAPGACRRSGVSERNRPKGGS